jgi:hypothetical protein
VVQIFRRCVPSSSGPVYPSGNGQYPGRLLQVGASIQLVNFYSWVKVLSCPLLTQSEKLVPDSLLIFYYLPSILRQKMAQSFGMMFIDLLDGCCYGDQNICNTFPVSEQKITLE